MPWFLSTASSADHRFLNSSMAARVVADIASLPPCPESSMMWS